MRNPTNIRKIALLAALAAVTATAWAMNDSYVAPQTTAATQSGALATQPAPAEPIALKETTIVSEPEAVPAPRALPVIDRSVQPPITIEERRLSEDERIQALVMDAILTAPRMTGKIGVESRDAVVTLTGWTATSGQATRAGMYAHRVSGVKSVDNQIRPRVG